MSATFKYTHVIDQWKDGAELLTLVTDDATGDFMLTITTDRGEGSVRLSKRSASMLATAILADGVK